MSDRPTFLLEHHLRELRLPTFLREYEKMAAQCAAERVDHPDYLLRLSELELIDRHHRMVERRIKAARFPTVKSLDTFDFLAIPSVNSVGRLKKPTDSCAKEWELLMRLRREGLRRNNKTPSETRTSPSRASKAGFETSLPMFYLVK